MCKTAEVVKNKQKSPSYYNNVNIYILLGTTYLTFVRGWLYNITLYG